MTEKKNAMTPALHAWKDTLARLRYERGQYQASAKQRRKDAAECKRRYDPVGALVAQDRETEYRRTAKQLSAEIDRIRISYRLR